MLWRKILLASIGLSFLILVGVIVLVIIGSFIAESDDNSITEGPDLSSSATNISVAPSAKAPDGQLSPESLELLVLYHELLRFLDDREFLAFCYAQASPAYEWGQRALELHATQDYSVVFREAGLGASEIRDLGWEYCQSQGRGDTPRARELRAQMKISWLNALPTPTPAPLPTLSPDAVQIDQEMCGDLYSIQGTAASMGLTLSETNQLLLNEGFTQTEIDSLVKECAIKSILDEP